MKTLLLLTFVVPLIAADRPSLNELQFMAGCWSGSSGPVTFEERWMAPAAGSMFGISRTMKQGRTIFFETFAIFEKDGQAVMSVRLKDGATTTPFKLVQSANGEAIFSNPEHDFPQRILYKRMPDGSLKARIDGVNKGKQAFEEFPMKRAACE
jgi:hypothetical protein